MSSAARMVGPTAGGFILSWGTQNNCVGLPFWIIAGTAFLNWILLGQLRHFIQLLLFYISGSKLRTLGQRWALALGRLVLQSWSLVTIYDEHAVTELTSIFSAGYEPS